MDHELAMAETALVGDVETVFDIERLPASFRKFLRENDIDPNIYTVTNLPRYVRLNTHLKPDDRPTIKDLEQQLETQQIWPVQGCSDVFGFTGAKKRVVDIPA